MAAGEHGAPETTSSGVPIGHGGEDWVACNRAAWDERVGIHLDSAFYDNESFRAQMLMEMAAMSVDDGLVLGLNHPRGPLAWADEIGVDRILAVLDALWVEYREERYRAAPLLRRIATFHE